MPRVLRRLEHHHLALITIGLAIVLFFALNLLSNLTIRAARLDLTEDRLYTLSEGTRETLAAIEEPVDLRFYYSETLDPLGPYFSGHARRVDELLAQYEQLSDGMVRVERIDPAPFSTEEDLAVAEGLRGLPVSDDGTLAYFGLSGRNATDDLEVIPYLAPERGDFLEYDLTRLVYDLAHPEKPVVAVVGDLPLMGAQFNQYQPWLVLEAMYQFFDVRFLGGEHGRIDDEVDVLLLAQPRDLSEKILYAIDQFVMRGGRVMALVDPFAEVLAGPRNPPDQQDGAVETLEPLLTAWGVRVPAGQVVGDGVAAQRVSARVRGREAIVQYLPWLALDRARLAPDDPVTARLERVVMHSAGWIEAREGAATTIEPLIRSSLEAAPIAVDEIATMPDPARLIGAFEPRGEPYVLAARVSGPVASAFRDGPPEGVELEDGEEHRAEAASPLGLVLIADADVLADQTWLRRQSMLGQDVAVPIANNGDFAVNALDHLAGSEALIGLRGRGLSVRPFAVIEAMEREAEMQFRAKEQQLLARIEETQAKIRSLQEDEQESGVILTAEQQEEIERFRAEMLDLREELRGVQRSLREDVEALEFRIKALNIGAVPVLIGLVAIGLALIRRVRAARFGQAPAH